ncbi:MAG TPA: VOC family protein [Rhizomicrobium sp.]|nr:VOC family protein [Rhizomicrobium sp.]
MTDAGSLGGRGLQQVALYCHDTARAREFYSGVLGLAFLFEASDMLFFQLKDMRLMVGKVRSPDQHVGGAILYFDAPDIDTLGPALEAKGVRFTGPAIVVQETATHRLKLREFRDPDGNALALMGLVAK